MIINIEFKNLFLKVLQHSQEKQLCWSLFLIKLLRACNFIKAFSCEYFIIFKNTYFADYLWTTAFLRLNQKRI